MAPRSDDVRLVVKVKPRSSREGLERDVDGGVVVRVNAPPVDGAANARVVIVVADALGVAKRAVRLVRGETSRHKELAIDGLDEAALLARLPA